MPFTVAILARYDSPIMFSCQYGHHSGVFHPYCLLSNCLALCILAARSLRFQIPELPSLIRHAFFLRYLQRPFHQRFAHRLSHKPMDSVDTFVFADLSGSYDSACRLVDFHNYIHYSSMINHEAANLRSSSRIFSFRSCPQTQSRILWISWRNCFMSASLENL